MSYSVNAKQYIAVVAGGEQRIRGAVALPAHHHRGAVRAVEAGSTRLVGRISVAYPPLLKTADYAFEQGS
jgi:hypothetical protein